MRISTVIGLIALVMSFAASALTHEPHRRSHDSGTKELETLQGGWRMIYAGVGDVELAEADLRTRHLTFLKNKYIMRTANEVWSEGTFAIDTSKNPKTLDANDAKTGKITAFVYVVLDDVLVLCSAPSKAPRPLRFHTKDGCTLIMYKRDK